MITMALLKCLILMMLILPGASGFAGECEDAAGANQNVLRISDHIRFVRRNLVAEVDAEVREQVLKWQNELDALPHKGVKDFFDEGNAGYRIANEIDQYAKFLIVSGENKKLEDLIRSIEVPVNSYELPTSSPTFLGEFLLTVAILVKNTGAVTTLLKLHKEKLIAEPQIRQWTLELSKSVNEVPEFVRLAPKIKFQTGPAYQPGLFSDVLKTDAVKAAAIYDLQLHTFPKILIRMLKSLFPNFAMSGLKNEKGEDILLDVSLNSIEESPQFFSLSVKDPQYFIQGRFEVFEDDSIVRLKFKDNVLDVIVKRSAMNQIFFARKNEKLPPYMRLSITFDKDKKIENISVSNGHLWLVPNWTTQTVFFPDKFTLQTKNVHFFPYGSEMFVQVGR